MVSHYWCLNLISVQYAKLFFLLMLDVRFANISLLLLYVLGKAHRHSTISFSDAFETISSAGVTDNDLSSSFQRLLITSSFYTSLLQMIAAMMSIPCVLL